MPDPVRAREAVWVGYQTNYRRVVPSVASFPLLLGFAPICIWRVPFVGGSGALRQSFGIRKRLHLLKPVVGTAGVA